MQKVSEGLPQEIQEPVQATWAWYDEDEEEHQVNLSLSGANHMIGISQQMGQLSVSTLRLWTDSEERRSGKATRLLRAGLVLAAGYGATISSTQITSPYALKIRKGIFGEGNIKFWEDRYTYGKVTGELPITVDQAILCLQRAKGFVENPDHETENDEAFTVVSDLTKVDMTNWERPIETNTPKPPLVRVTSE